MIRLKLLGSTELRGDDGVELERILAQPKRLALLAFLAVSRGFHRRDSLLAMFWPEFDPTRGRDALNQAVRFLRKEMNDGAGALLISRGSGELGLDTSAFWCDTTAFLEAVEAHRFTEALALYRGDLLPGFFSKGAEGFERWLEDERPRLRRAAARAARELADVSERAGESNRAVAAARRAVELAGLDEPAVRELLVRLDRMGDRAGALGAFDAFARRLVIELGAEPSAETQAVVDRIRRRGAGNERGIGRSPASIDAATRADTLAGNTGQTLGAAVLPKPPANSIAVQRMSRRPVLIGAVGIAALTIAGFMLTAFSVRTPRYYAIDPPPGLRFNKGVGNGLDIAISRDGEAFAFTAGPDKQLFVRREGESAASAFPGVTNVYDLHFSPGGERLAYRTVPPNGGLTVLRIDGGPGTAEPVQLFTPSGWSGTTWGHSTDIVLGWNNALWRAPLDGTPRMIAAMDSTVDIAWHHPTMLPDGNTIAFPLRPIAVARPDSDRVALISIDGGARRVLDLVAEGVIGYVEGALIISRRSAISGHAQVMAVPVDLRRATVSGEPVVLLDSVEVKTRVGAMAVLSVNGTFAYLASPPSAEILQIVDSRAAVLHQVNGLRMYRQMTWSPDGRKVAMYVMSEAMPYIAVYDVASGVLTPLHDTNGFAPAWTPDGKRIAFLQHETGRHGGKAMWVPADGSSHPTPIPALTSFGSSLIQILFSPDSRSVVVRTATKPTPGEPNAFVVPLDGGEAVPAAPESPNAWELAFSPDGRWLAYHEATEKTPDVYVRNVRTGERVRLSNGGGYNALWSADSRKLFYRLGSRHYVVSLDISGSLPRVLRTERILEDSAFAASIRSHDVHPDGKRFVVSRDVGGGSSLKVIENFGALVRQKLARR